MNAETEERRKTLRWRDIVVACVVVFAFVALDVVTWRMGYSSLESVMWMASFLAMVGLPAIIARHRKIDLGFCTVEKLFSWRDLLWGMGAMAILFVPIVVGHGVWMTLGLGAKAAFSWSNFDAILPQIPSEILWQFLGVALPEEYFYRGFVQTNIAYRLEQSPRRSLQKYAAPISIALASMIFASLHVVNGGFVRLVTFFPGCLFGFLRYKTNGIAGAVFAHAMCNLMMFALNIQYL